MPTYTFKNRETGEIHEQFMMMAELDPFKESNPHLECVPGKPPMIIDPIRLGVTKPSPEFRERLKEIKKTHLHNNINDI
jgi:hypothetical protein